MAARPLPAIQVPVHRSLQNRNVPVFIVHHGKRPKQDSFFGGLDCMKRIAIDIKSQLQEDPQPVPTFVDDIDLPPGSSDADARLRQALWECKVRVTGVNAVTKMRQLLWDCEVRVSTK